MFGNTLAESKLPCAARVQTAGTSTPSVFYIPTANLTFRPGCGETGNPISKDVEQLDSSGGAEYC